MKLYTALFCGIFAASSALAGGDAKHPIQQTWSFDGMLGVVDKPSAQRGFQVYKEVCASCHSLSRISFRNLHDLGFSEAEVKALASSYEVQDGPNDDGEMFMRPGRPSDKLPSPYANEKQGRSLNNGAYPPDLSLMVKARPDGANYLYSLLTGYEDAPADVALLEGQHYNPYYAGQKIAMPKPLSDGQVQYMDNTEASVDQMSKDVVYFLQWAAEPEMEARKRLGLKMLSFVGIMTIIFYLTKRKIWSDLH
ncbi:MAG: cytochrome c1 [Alphaproteobacteria bacterium]|nr:MAG: cytochrome c1 [Alphaproteobacteria bacterium]TAF16027.1 MAG: cytochrome c1 [Alphaproteobacteria bacterium]TAF39260.1 MAG: cytochrome c1 [Alphaproteobacteria bacterium]TAF76229.1 MAG: cytochrome c1 [Alphaproteobacteria bacterium]